MVWKIISPGILQHYRNSSEIFGLYVVKNGAKYIVRDPFKRML